MELCTHSHLRACHLWHMCSCLSPLQTFNSSPESLGAGWRGYNAGSLGQELSSFTPSSRILPKLREEGRRPAGSEPESGPWAAITDTGVIRPVGHARWGRSPGSTLWPGHAERRGESAGSPIMPAQGVGRTEPPAAEGGSRPLPEEPDRAAGEQCGLRCSTCQKPAQAHVFQSPFSF